MGYRQDERNATERIQLTGILGEFREALEDEIKKIKANGQSSTLLRSGRRMEGRGAQSWYRFKVDYAPALPADTPCKLVVGKEAFDVTIIGFDEDELILAAEQPLPEALASARLENGATVLMERLIKRIEENAEKVNRAGRHMLPAEGGVYASRRLFEYDDLRQRAENTESQNRAVSEALSSDITYIWGPPGTGKTTVIGQIIDELYRHDRSVLVVSHTNTAVDGAIEKADKAYMAAHSEPCGAYPILRMGTPVRPLPERVRLEHHVALLGRELHELKTELEREKAELLKRAGELAQRIAKAVWVEKSELSQIESTLKSIAGREEDVRAIDREIEGIGRTIQRERAAHPECEAYEKRLQTIQKRKKDFEAHCRLRTVNEGRIDSLRSQRANVQGEIKKHDEYEALCAQERGLGTASSIRAELDKIKTDIAELGGSMAKAAESKADAEKIIASYEKKNSIAKLLSGRSGVAQARSALQRTQEQLTHMQAGMQRLRGQERELEQRLERLFALREQINAVMPSQTRTIWEDRLRLMDGQLKTEEKLRDMLCANEAKLRAEIAELESQQSAAKAAYDEIQKYEEELRRAQTSMVKAKADLEQEKSCCAQILEREIAYCTAFSYTPAAQESEALFDELAQLMAAVAREVGDDDAASLMREREDAEHELARLHHRINEVNQKIQELEKQAIMNAKIVGATLAKSYLSDVLRARTFDTVILDEASMASVPALWCAAYLAENSVVIVGDFLQLSPIVMADTPMAKKWLGRDIFDHSGMQELAKKPGKCPKNFVMLNDQFRMESDIAAIANMYYGAYGGLRSHDASRARERDAFYSWFPGESTKQHIHLIDTESLHAWATGVPQGQGHSRMNVFSAAVDVDLAFKLLENRLGALDPATARPSEKASVLIIAPYKPHVKRIGELIELEYRNRGFGENLNLVRTGTIHSFQGSEADIVIFDLVVDEPHWRANLFMTGEEVNEGLRRMFNVAVTRARFQLYIVGDFKFCRSKAKNNALSELLDFLLDEKGLAKIDAKALLPNLTYTRPTDFTYDGKRSANNLICQESSFGAYFMADIRSFKKRLIIYSPFMTQARIGALLPAFADATASGKQIVVVTKALSERKPNERAHYRQCEKGLRDIGVHILYKKGMHEKMIFVDRDAVWIGSLNALSYTGQTGEVMHRHADSGLTAEYVKQYEIEHISGVAERAHEQKCPICGGELQIREGKDGSIYWACEREDYTRKTNQPYPVDGTLCCATCGAPYAFVMKDYPRWVCTQHARHQRKMKESDLKLEKMAALIPTRAARREVDRYFAKQKKEKAAKQNTAAPKKGKTTAKKKDTEFEQMKMF